MPNKRKPSPNPELRAVSGSAPQRSQTLKRRISSGFNTFLAALPIPRATPRSSPTLRSSTAFGEGVIVQRIITGANPRGVQQLPVIRVHVPSLSESSHPCPYDSNNYHSFPSVERSRCSFCGMRPPRSPSSEPCNECRSRTALSHMRSAFWRKTSPKVKNDAIDRNPSLPQYSSSSEEGPRIVPAEVAARRVGNPPRRAALPVPRPGAVNNSMNPPADQRILQSSEHNDVRPTSPKLHYHRGLPNSKDHPYVLRSEVSQHLDAICAGEPSPLIDFARAARLKKASDRTTDFSETVYYGDMYSAAFTNSPEQRGPLQPPHSNLVVEGYLETGGHVVVERPRPEQQASIDAQLYSINRYPRRTQEQSQQNSRASKRSCDDHHRTRRTESKAGSSTNDQRPDFQEGPANDVIPRLRGGSGREEYTQVGGCGLMLKQLLLTCHRPDHGYATDSGSDENLPPARTPNPSKVARAYRRAHGISRIPKGVSRRDRSHGTPRMGSSAAGSGCVTDVSLSRTASFIATHPQPRSILSCLPEFGATSMFARPSVPSVDRTASSTNVAVQPTIQPPLVSLRGGAGSSSALRDHRHLPPTLFWLAGGRGKPMTIASWKGQKPKKRMSGLLGMALHGLDAGTEYEKDKSMRDGCAGTGVLRNTPVVPEANKSVKGEKAESVNTNRTRSSRSSVLPKSSMKSHGSQPSNSSKSAASGGEAQREALLEPVPEEAAAPAAADHVSAGAAAVGNQPLDIPDEHAPLVEDPQREPAGVGLEGEASTPS